MKYEFANGTAKQQKRWEEAAHHLLHLSADDIKLTVAASFVDPSTLTGHGHTDLALTTYSYDATSATTEIRSDAPSFGDQLAALKSYAASLGLPFSIERFYMETAVHELGHALFAALPEARRVAIAEMFGARSDSIAEINNSSKPWQDRISEAIAETFKEAFLPRRFRVFPNRTNRHIPYHRYNEFRSLFRGGVEQITGIGTPVPAYNLDVYKQYQVSESPLVQVYQPEPSEIPFFPGTFDKGSYDDGLYKQLEGWEPPLEHVDNTLYKQYRAESATDTLLVPRGTHFAGSILLPQDIDFYGPSEDFAPIHGAHQGEGGFAGAFTWEEIHNNKELEDPFGQFEQPFGDHTLGLVVANIWFTYWKPSTETWVCWDYRSGSIIGFEPEYKIGNPHPKFPGSTSEHTGCWIIMKGDGRANIINEGDAWSIPIGTVSLASDVPSFAPTIETCGGDMVRARIFAQVTLKTGVSKQDSLSAIQSRLPSFQLTRGAKICKSGRIEVPPATLEPGASTSGRRRMRHPVHGGGILLN